MKDRKSIENTSSNELLCLQAPGAQFLWKPLGESIEHTSELFQPPGQLAGEDFCQISVNQWLRTTSRDLSGLPSSGQSAPVSSQSPQAEIRGLHDK